MKFCIIIINYNTKQNVLQLAIEFSVIDSDIIICDNSTLIDEVLTPSELAHYNTRAYLLISKINLGFGKTINNAIDSFNIRNKYDYFVLWNSDCELNQDYFNEICGNIIKEKRRDIIAPRLFDGQDFYYGSRLSWHLLTSNAIHDEQFNYSNSISWPTAAALFLPTCILTDRPLFDPFFFMYWEDADLIQVLKNNGVNINNFKSNNSLYFNHSPGYSSSSNLTNRYLWHLEGHRYFMKKHFRFYIIPCILINCKYLVKALFDLNLTRFRAILNFIIK